MSDDVAREQYLKAHAEECRAALAARRDAATQATPTQSTPATPATPNPAAFDPARAKQLLSKDDLLLFFSEVVRSDAASMRDRLAASKLLADAYHMFDEIPEALRNAEDLAALSNEALLRTIQDLQQALEKSNGEKTKA